MIIAMKIAFTWLLYGDQPCLADLQAWSLHRAFLTQDAKLDIPAYTLSRFQLRHTQSHDNQPLDLRFDPHSRRQVIVRPARIGLNRRCTQVPNLIKSRGWRCLDQRRHWNNGFLEALRFRTSCHAKILWLRKGRIINVPNERKDGTPV